MRRYFELTVCENGKIISHRYTDHILSQMPAMPMADFFALELERLRQEITKDPAP